MKAENTRVYEFGGFRLDAAKRLLLRADGEPVPLTPKVFETLVYLVQNSGRVVEKDELLSAVWTDTIVEENNLNQNISALRKIFGEKRGEHRFIATVPGQGYKFVAEVCEISGSVVRENESDADSDGFTQTQNSDFSLPLEEGSQFDIPKTEFQTERKTTRKGESAADKKTSRAWLIAISAIVALALGAFGFYLWRERTNQVAVEDAPIKTIAVLPFKPLVTENRDESLEMGMADTLISKLGSGEQIIVRPLSSVRRYAALEQDSLSAGRQLGVEAVLDGTIQTSNERIRVSARLIRTSDGKQLWAGQFDEKFTDIFTVQDSITEKAAVALKTRLEKRPKSYTENVEAYRLYLRGRYHNLKFTATEIQTAASYFQKAIDADPNYALAYAGLADAYRGLALPGEVPASEIMPKAKAAALKAVELDDNLAEAHAFLGHIIFWYDWDWKAAENEFKRALELDPNSADAHEAYAHVLSYTGRHEEALAEIKRAGELDPLNVRLSVVEGSSLINAGRVDEAIGKLQNVLELEPNYWFARQYLASAYIEKGLFAEATVEANKAKEHSGMATRPVGFLGYALAKAGRQTEARAEVEQLVKMSKIRHVSPYSIAMIYNGLGEVDEAMLWLKRGYEQREPRMVFLKVEPKWNNLRSEPRFIELMRRMNF